MSGEELYKLREEWALTQEQFGRLFGYTAKSIANLEHERHNIPNTLILHIELQKKLRLVKKLLENVLETLDRSLEG